MSSFELRVPELVQPVVDKTMGWLQGGVTMLPNLIVAVLTLGVAWAFAGFAARIAQRPLQRLTRNDQLGALGARILHTVLVVAGAFVALSVLQLDKTVTSLLAGVGIVGIALGFAFQDIASNFMAGVLMAVRRPIRIGDVISSNGFSGTVIDVELRSTLIRTFTGETVILPNKDVFGSPIVNYTDTRERRADVRCGVAYDADLEEVRRVVVAALEALPQRDERREVTVVFDSFGDSSIEFVARVWMDTARQADHVATRSAMIVRIKAALDEVGIEIPFPIRTLSMGPEVAGPLRRLADHFPEELAAK